jgi:hypothetical protein
VPEQEATPEPVLELEAAPAEPVLEQEATPAEPILEPEASTVIEPEHDEPEEETLVEAVAAPPFEAVATLGEPQEERAAEEVLAHAPVEADASANVAEPSESPQSERVARGEIAAQPEKAAPEVIVLSPPARPTGLASEPPRREIPQDPLADIRDDVDTQVLPIFLEEAAELYPKQASRSARGAVRRTTTPAHASFGARSIRSRAVRGWPARCDWASSSI